ncbi:Transcription factor [Sporothrix epigloea]|uniref:Transcription factor n=1 Tax=Sporothrix epigloea TaxID=1892477 RepID=A0ABP0DW12_9PEZI
MDKDPVHKAATRIAPASDPKAESKSNSEDKAAARNKAAPNNGDAAAAADNGNGDTSHTPKKRRKVNHACVYCRRSERPCTRCIKRNIGHLCHDEPRDSESRKSKSVVGDTSVADDSEDFKNSRASLRTAGNASARARTSSTVRPPLFDAGKDMAKPALIATKLTGQTESMPFVRPGPASGRQLNAMASNDVSQCYMVVPEVSGELQFLNDFLHSSMVDNATYVPDDPSRQLLRSAPPDVATNFITSRGDNVSGASGVDGRLILQNDGRAELNDILLPPSALGSANGAMLPPERGAATAGTAASGALDVGSTTAPLKRSAAIDKTRDYYFQAADPSGNDTPEQRMSNLLKAKYDAGLLKPFNYVRGYAHLHKYLDSHKIAPASKQKIQRQLDRFRPKFREKMQALTDLELIYVEMWFEKTLMEYDRVFASMAVPACCWRRTGEIFRGNKEMAELIHVPVESLRDGKIALHEILTEESMVRYWEEFGTIAFDSGHDTLLTACSLKNPNDASKDPIIKCCFSLKIRRDDHKM